MSPNTIPMLIINQCAQNCLCASFGKILPVLIHKHLYRDYLHVYSRDVILPLVIPPLSRNSMARYI